MTSFALPLFLLLSQVPEMLPVQDRSDMDVDQLTGQQPPVALLSVPNVAPSTKGANPAIVQQLPPTLDEPAERGNGEGALIRGEDRKTLAGEVARTAELLRQRGQQPTAEALAREIGPDVLAAFLDQDPSGPEGYAPPKAQETAPLPLPEGVNGPVVILPPSAGN